MRNSLLVPSLPFLSIGPRLDIEPTHVTAGTRPPMLWLTLGAWRDRIEVDSRAKEVRIWRRRFYFWNQTRTVRFQEVAHVAYALIDHGSALGDERGHAEIFDIALALHSGEEVPLFRFSGDGEFVADVSLFGERLADRWREITDVRGRQQEDSLGAVELLSARIGVPVGPSRYF